MRAILWTFLLAVAFGLLYAVAVPPLPALAGPEWKGEFEEVCGRTDAAMTLSPEELEDLVRRCDRLKERIESEEESTRKVYLRRLKSCRDLYLYVLETRKGG